ncbi:MAG: GAF domain-containing SpoIIE family protein phosphatase [Chloroflexota bacterium]
MLEQPKLDPIDHEHLRTLYDITRAMNSSLDFDEVLSIVIDAMMQVTRAQRGFLMVAEDNGDLRIRVARTLDGSPAEESYSTTIVNQVVETRQPLLTNNAQFDPRYKAGQSIIAKGLRAILCAPMIVRNRLVGVVYVDTSIRTGTFKESDLHLLSAVAGQAAVAIENARLYRVAVEKGRLEHELQMARDIQQSLLPRRMPQVPGYEIAARWQSAREVAGDFYDLFALADDTLGVVIADVADKGAAAALFMASARSMIRTHALAGFSPVETLARTNDLIVADASDGTFVTVYYSLFGSDGAAVHVNAGHNPPVIYRRTSNRVSFMPRGGRALGWFLNNPLKPLELRLEPGDVIVYYTDGLTDAENATGDNFGEARLAQALTNCAQQPVTQILDYLIHEVECFCDGVPAFDDLTLCVVRYLG